MKRLHITGLLLLTIVGTQYSCNKITSLKPTNEISSSQYWNTADQYKLAANDFYTYLLSFANVLYDPYDGNTNGGSPHSDLRGDLVSNANRNVISNGGNNILVSDGNWSTAYIRLRNINTLLAQAQSYPIPAEITKYVAEAKFFRAYVYFDLLEQFGGVPLVDKVLDPDAPELQAPRNSRDEVADFIIKDLEAAIPNLPTESANAAADKGRITKGAAQAFLGRVCLYEGTWQKFRGNTARANSLLDKSITNTDAVIASAQYSLFAPAVLGDSALKYLFVLEDEKSNPANITKASNKEYILASRYSFSQRQIRQNVTHTWLGAIATKKLADMFLCSDGLPVTKSSLFKGYATTRSEYTNRENRMRYTMMIDSNYYWDNENPGARTTWLGDAADIASSRGRQNNATGTGYLNQKWGTERRLNDNEEGYDWPVIRLAEVYLNYAEAVYEKNGSITDADLDKSLNLVRNRVNKTMPKLSNTLVSANGLDMRVEIRRERTVELFLEGFRFDDLKRWKTAETEMPMNLTGISWTGTTWQTRWKNSTGGAPYTLDANGNIIYEASRKWAEKNYLYPIPSKQIQLNPNLAQNTGW